MKDHYGNMLSTHAVEAVEAYDAGVAEFLAGQYGAVETFERAVEADPAFALGHAALARARMMGGDMQSAREAMSVARNASRLNAREASHVAAMSLALNGKAPQARAAVKAHVQAWPCDAMIAQLCTNVFGLIGFSGKVGRESELLAYTGALLPHYGEDWWMMSMHALSLCETGQTEASLTLMEHALALNPRNANGSHFKAHAQYEAGETEAGRAYLSDWIADYDARSVLHGHLTWHLALWALHAGDEVAMWQAVDGGIAPGATQSLPINVLTDTAAIYHRAALAGMQVDAQRWSDLSDYAARCFPNAGQSFADMHAALSHAMAGQGDRLAKLAETSAGFAGDLVAPLARAWNAVARQDWQAALEEMTPVMAASERVGGSRAQRDLIELSYANILIKLGKTDEARRVLRLRRPVLSASAPLEGYSEVAA